MATTKQITVSFGTDIFVVTPAMQDVFNAADSKTVDWALTLAQEGLTTRALARPFVVIWAGAKYGKPVTQGQRGLMVPQDSDAARAVDRVLKVVFAADDAPKAQKSSGSQDPVDVLLKKFKALTPAQQKKFKAAI